MQDKKGESGREQRAALLPSFGSVCKDGVRYPSNGSYTIHVIQSCTTYVFTKLVTFAETSIHKRLQGVTGWHNVNVTDRLSGNSLYTFHPDGEHTLVKTEIKSSWPYIQF